MKKIRIIAVIPARGGSKAIPKKNIRRFIDKPLIAHVISAISKVKLIQDIYVSTDDDEIEKIADYYGAKVIKRPKALAEDHITLDPVIFHSSKEIEKRDGSFDYLITIQPTCPLLKSSSIQNMLEKMMEDQSTDTMLSVVNDTHLSWRKEQGNFLPNYKQRLNRQNLPPNFRETGGVLCSKKDCISESNRIGSNIALYELSQAESVDIDNNEDWLIAESLYHRKRVAFVVKGYHEIGTGHVYRGIQLAAAFTGHEALFLCVEPSKLAFEIAKDNHFNTKLIHENDILHELARFQPDLVINDQLNTSEDYIKELKNNKYFTVNFEDFGSGADHANLVFNPLHDEVHFRSNTFYGQNYFILRDEFLTVVPVPPKENASHVLITFGGSDPSNLSLKVVQEIVDLDTVKKITLVLGKGYGHLSDLDAFFNSFGPDSVKVEVVTNTNKISKYMLDADIAISSSGRTIFELAHCGTPTIVLAQHDREMTHSFAQMKNGFIKLDLGTKVSKSLIRNTINMLLEGHYLRKEMSSVYQQYDFKNGVFRVKKLIFDGLNGLKIDGNYRKYILSGVNHA